MTKKKRNHPDVDEVLSRPWCYYCERDFDDLKILINHQKAKHFKCERCGRRLNTAGGLSVHMSQVHKENLTAVDNALPNRAGLDIEIFGMEGIPDEVAQQHTQRVLTSYHQAQADRQAATGNPVPGAAGANGLKKPKMEATSDLKKRLAEHKAAKLAAEQGDGSQSGSGTPQPTSHAQASPSNGYSGSPSYSQYQQPYNALPSNGSYGQPPSYSATPPAAGYPPQPAYGQPPSQPVYGQPSAAPSYQSQPYAQPPQPSFQNSGQGSYPPQPAFSPPSYQNQNSYPSQAYQPSAPSHFPGQPRTFGAGSPAPPFPQHTSPPPNAASFPKPIATGTVSLPNAPGLPQRPAFGAPPVNAFQFQQMHQGQIPVPQNHVMQPQYNKQSASPPALQPQHNGPIPVTMTQAPNAASIDDLISSASRQADVNAGSTPSQAAATPAPVKAEAPVTTPAPAPAKEDVSEDKTVKKDKDKDKSKATRLVYSDNDISPEEKMAMLPRYAFDHDNRTITV